MADEEQYRAGRAIRSETVRVIGADGAQLGVLTTEDALHRASDAGLDLVEINPMAVPPVCKIMDFAEFRRTLARRRNPN
jgi:translation initiation factor IF-3